MLQDGDPLVAPLSNRARAAVGGLQLADSWRAAPLQTALQRTRRIASLLHDLTDAEGAASMFAGRYTLRQAILGPHAPVRKRCLTEEEP